MTLLFVPVMIVRRAVQQSLVMLTLPQITLVLPVAPTTVVCAPMTLMAIDLLMLSRDRLLHLMARRQPLAIARLP